MFQSRRLNALIVCVIIFSTALVALPVARAGSQFDAVRSQTTADGTADDRNMGEPSRVQPASITQAPASSRRLFDGEPGGVTLFQDAQYAAQAEFFSADDRDLADNPIGTYAASSIIVSPTVQALLFNAADYQGWVTQIVSDTPDLTTLGFNDAAASLKVLPYPIGPISVTDEFDGSVLDSAWNWNTMWASGATYSLTEQPGQLRLTMPAGDRGYLEDIAHLQRFDIGRGDFTVETQLSLTQVTPGAPYWTGVTLGLSHPQRIFFGLADRNRLIVSRWGRSDAEVTYAGTEINLRVQKQGQAVEFAYRETSTAEWQVLTTWYISDPFVFAGLFIRTGWGGEVLKIDFDHFQLIADDTPTPIPPTPEPDIQDDFAAPKLNHAWRWHSTQAGVDPSLLNAPGNFQMTLPAGDVSYDGWADNAPQLRRVDMADDWAIQTRLNLADTSLYDTCCFHAGLVVGFDTVDYFAFGLTHNRLLQLEWMGRFYSTFEYTDPSIELRVEKTGDRYLFKYRSTDSAPWTIYDTRYVAQPVQWVGLIGRAWDNRQTPVTLNYDYFDLTGVHTAGVGLKGEYFNNTDLSSSPVITRIDPQIDFAWGYDRPAPEVEPDYFSVRWTGQVEAPTSDDYTFSVTADDGMRLWVDNQLLINHWDAPWIDNPTITLTAGQRYSITLEYFENWDVADVRLEWSTPSVSQQVIPASRLYPDAGVWTLTAWPEAVPADGETASTLEVNLTDLADLPQAGLPVYLQITGINNRINGQAIAADDWVYIDDTDASGTVTAELTAITPGTKVIRARVQDVLLPETAVTFTPLPAVGLQILLPDELPAPGVPGGKSGEIIRQTSGQSFAIVVRAVDAFSNTVTSVTGIITLTTTDARGNLPVTVTLESGVATTPVILETVGTHTLQATLAQLGTAMSSAVDVGPRGIGLTGEYFNNMEFSGVPDLLRIDAQVDFAWGGGSPAPEIGYDNFSARWTGQLAVPLTDNYVFRTLSDDGIRLYIDEQLVIENWTDHSPTWDYSTAIPLAAGQRYSITVEFYENGGGADAHLEWSSAQLPWEVIPSARLYPTSGLWTLAVEPSTIAVDDEAGAQVQVQLTDLASLPEADRPVSIQVRGRRNQVNSFDVLEGEWIEIGDTNAEGLVTATLTSIIAETKVVRARVDGVVLTEREVTFEPGQPIGLQILLPGEVSAPGEPGGKIEYPWDQRAGEPFDLLVRAVDVYFNTATSFTGTIDLSTTDPLADLPAAADLINGAATISVTLKTANTDTNFEAENIELGSATSEWVYVEPGPAVSLTLDAPEVAQLLELIPITITQIDAYGNESYDEIEFSSSDSQATLPYSAYTYRDAVFRQSGTHTLTARIGSDLIQTVTITVPAGDVVINAYTFFTPGIYTYPHIIVQPGGNLVMYGDSATGTGVTLYADTLTIEQGGQISSDSQGHWGGQGIGAGSNGSGAGHGGIGGSMSGLTGGGIYDSLYQPAALGSGGGGQEWISGGTGGGAIRLVVADTLTIAGNLSANGGNGYQYYSWVGGGGSGGSIWLEAGTIAGTGTIQANGGLGGALSELSGGSGAGGRIAIYAAVDNFDGAIRVNGGAGLAPGQSGTIYLNRVDPQTSTISAPATIVAGYAGEVLTVTLVTTSGVPIANEPVHLKLLAGLPISLSQQTVVTGNQVYIGTTDATGAVTTIISGTRPGSRTIEAWSGPVQRQFRLFDLATSAVTPGPADPNRSTVTLNPQQVTADGQSPITVTIVLSDAFGNRATDRPIALPISGVAITTTPATLTTDGHGVAIGQFVSTRAQTATVRVVDATFGVTLTAQPSAVFVPGPVSLETSSLGVVPLQACADGYDPLNVTLNLLDAFYNAEPNRRISFYAPGTTITLTPASARTNADGQAWTSITSRDVQSITVSAVDETDDLTLTHTLPVSFVPCKTDPDRSLFSATPDTLIADGTSPANIVVTLRDAAYQPRVGHAVTLTLTGSDHVLQGPFPALTGEDGVVTFTLASTRVEAKSITAIDLTDVVTLTPRRTVTYTVGPIDPAASLLVSNDTTLIADGVDYATLTATLYDSYNHPLPGKVVRFETTGTSITLTQLLTTTNAQGRVQAMVRSSDVQTATITAIDESDGVTLMHDIPIGFVAGPAVAAHSDVVVTPDHVVADGVQSAAIAVTLRDALDHPANNRLVRLTVIGSNDTVTPDQGTTDAAGTIVFHLTSTRAEIKHITVNDVTDGLALDAGSITFEPGPFNASVSTLTASATEAPNDGVSPITLTARVLDAWANPIPNATVIFAANITGVTLTQPISATDSSGYASGSIVGTTMQPFAVTASVDGTPIATSVQLNFVGIDLTLSQSALGQVKVGRSLTYTLNVANDGLVTAPQVVLTDTLPTYMSFVTQTSPYPFTVSDGVVVWQLGDVAPDAHIQLSMEAYLSRTAPIGLSLINQAVVRAPVHETDLSDNFSQRTTVSAPRTPRLAVSPVATTLVARAGDTATFTVTVRNDGSDELTGVTAAPPPHMAWLQLGQTAFPELLPGQEISFMVTANVPSDLAAGYYRDLIRFNSLEGGQQMIALTIQVQNATRDLVVRLNNIDGDPVPNVQIALNKSIYVVTEGNPSTQLSSQLVASNADGELTLTQQDPGNVSYAITAFGYYALAGSFTIEEGVDPQIVSLMMTANLGLAFTPAAPQLNVVPGEGALLDVGVRSTSLITTYNISVTSPSTIDWVYLGRSGELEALEPGGSFTLTINAVPPVDALPGVYTDTIGVHADGGLSVTLPFTIVISPDPYRDLQVTVLDTDDNPIVGAQLELIRQQSTFLISGTITNTVRETRVAQTDSNGQTVFLDLPLGVYNYYISANGYQAKTGSLEVVPGDGLQEETIRMPRPGLNVSWVVVPTTFQDIYTATLQLIFDPFAPEPTIGCGPLHECFKPQEALQVHNSYPVTIENAQIDINFSCPVYYNSDLGAIGPNATITVPVTFGSECCSSNRPCPQPAAVEAGMVTVTGDYRHLQRASAYNLQALAAPPLAPGIVYTIPVKLVNQGLPSNGNLYGEAPALEDVTLSQPPVLDWIVVKPAHFSRVAVNEEVDFELEVHVPQWLAEGKYSDAVIISASGGITTVLEINAEMKGDGLHIETQYVTPLVPDLSSAPAAPEPFRASEPLGATSSSDNTLGGTSPWWTSHLMDLYPTESEKLRMDWPIERTCCRNCPHDPVYFWGWFGGYFATIVSGGGNIYAPEFKRGLVYLEINQRISLEREAFIASMVLEHGGGAPIEAITATITVNDGSGASWVVAPGEGAGFVVQPIVPTPLGGLTSGQSRFVSWTLIPDDLGITEPDGRQYTVQAQVTYVVDGALRTVHTQSVPITVKPQPKVVLDYYIPNYVYEGEPFKLYVMATNIGYGPAKNLQIESAQPKIVKNDSGLPIDFTIISSLIVDFGELAAGATETASWDIVANHDGAFIDFKAKCGHVNYLGLKLSDLVYCNGTAHFYNNVRPKEAGNWGKDSACLVNRVQGFSSDPVNTYFGNFTYSSQDVTIPTWGDPLMFERTYNSRDTATGPLGPGWTHNYNLDLTYQSYLPISNGVPIAGPIETMEFKGPRGSRLFYALEDDGSFKPFPGVKATLTRDLGIYTVTLPSQAAYVLDARQRLYKQIDSNGNVLTMLYAGDDLIRVTDPSGRSLNFDYDDQGHILAMTDPLGRVTRYGYDEYGYLKIVTDTRGFTTTMTYTGMGGWRQLESITDANGHVTVLNFYDSRGRVVQQADAAGKITNFTYATGQTTITDPRGATTTDYYNDDGLLTRRADTFGNYETYEYDTHYNRVAMTDKNNHRTVYAWDAQSCNMTAAIDALGYTTHFTSDERQRLTTLTDALNHSTSMTYGDFADPLTVTDPLGRTSRYTYEVHGKPIVQVDPASQVSFFEYDAYGNQTVITNALGQATSMAYDLAGRVITITDALGRVAVNEYDAADHLLRTIGPAGPIITYTYDAVGNRLTETNANNHTLTRTYDVRNNLRAVTNEAGATTIYTYDANNNQIGATDANGHTTTIDYDGLNRPITITDALSGTVVYTYDPVGNRLTETDANGRKTSYGYDEVNHLIRTTDPLNHTTTFGYDAVGRKTSVTDALGRVTRTEYDDGGRIMRVIANYHDGLFDPARPDEDLITRNIYDTAGNVVQVIDPAGQVTHFDYDAVGRVLTTTSALNGTTVYAYDAVGNKLAVTDAEGRTTRFEYDELNRPVTITNALSGTAVTVYDALGNRLAVTDPNGHTTHFDYNALNQLITVTNALSGATVYTYDAVGNQLTVTDAAGQTTAYTYDPLDRLIQVTNALSGTTTYGYDRVGNRTTVTDANGHTTTYTFDPNNRLTAVTDALSQTVQHSYDAVGNPLVNIDARGHSTHFTYDGVNRLISSTDALSGTTTFAYDAAGNRIALTDPEGRTTRFGYDALSRPITTTNALGGSTLNQYDAVGNQIAVTDAEGRTTTLAYDDLNRPITITSPLSGKLIYAYDAVGNRLSQIDPAGRITRFDYDALDRVITTTDPLTGTTVNTYDIVGNLIQTRNARSQTLSYAYDPIGRLITATDALSGTTVYTYDAVGNRLAITDPEGRTTRVAYDAVNRPVTVTDALTQTTSITYDEAGNRLTLTDAKDQTSRFEYDALNRLMHSADPTGAVTRYEYDRLGNQTVITDPLGQVTRFTYDELYRLVVATDPLNQTARFAYDRVGNRTLTTDTLQIVTHYEYDALNQLIAVVENYRPDQPVSADANVRTTYAYDQIGNRIVVTDANTHTSYYAYDALNRLIQTTDALGHAYHFTYDPVGNLIGREDANGVTTNYSYDDLNRLINIVYPEETVNLAYDRVGNRTTMTDSLGITRYQYDPLYRLETVVDPYSQAVTYTYDAVGNRTGLMYPGGAQTAYSYDAAGRPITVTDGSAGATTYQYDAAGRPLTATLPNGVQTIYRYDDAGRLIELAHLRGSSVIARYEYELDALGNRVAVTETLMQPSGPATVAVTVRDTDGVPQVGLPVYAFSGSTYMGYNGTTNAAGQVTLTLPSNNYRFRVDKNGTQFWSETTNHCAVPLCTSAAITVSVPTVVAVVDTTGAPQAGLPVYAFNGTAYTGYHATTTASGQALLTLPPGSYHFRADKNGTQFWSGSTNHCTIPGCTTTSITVSVPMVVLVTDTDGTPQIGLPVYAFNGTTYTGYNQTTNAAGQATLTLPLGDYRFRADKNGTQFWSGLTNHCTIPGCLSAAITTSIPTLITVLDPNGAPEVGLPVYAFDGTTYTGYNKTTNASGQVTLTLPLGNYRFRADKNGTQFWSGSASHCAVPGCLSAAITTSIPTLVTVLDPNGSPEVGLPVFAFNGTTYTGYNGTTDVAGQVTLTLPAGSYRFRADKNGTQFWSGAANHCTMPGCTGALITTSLLTVVTVQDSTGSPEVGLPVYAFDGTTYSGYTGATDATGQVTFTLPAGNYRFRVDKNSTQFWSGAVNHCAVPGCAAVSITTSLQTIVTVQDTSGVLQAGLPVYAFNGTTYTGHNGVTNASGQVTFTLPAGTYHFRVDKNSTQFWSDTANHCAVPGCVAVSVTVAVPVVVTVQDTDGTPQAGLSVYGFNGTTYTGYNGRTNASGQVTLTLPIGSYRFRADKNGTQFWSGTTNHCALPGCTSVTVTVSIPTVVNVLDTNGAAQAGLPVYAFDGTTYTGYNKTTDANGQVTLTLPLALSGYRFRADKNGTQFWSGAANHCLIPGCTVVTTTVSIPVIVTVQNTDGVPQAGLPVYAFDGTTYTGYNKTTDAAGQVTLTLPIGSYRFRADKNGTQFWSDTGSAGNHCFIPGCTSASIVVAVPVVVTVQGSTGVPQSDVTVYAFNGTTYTGYTGRTNASGQVTLTLPLGNYRFRADQAGLQYWSNPVNHCAIPGCTAATITLSTSSVGATLPVASASNSGTNTSPTTSRPILVDPSVLLLAPLAVLVMTGKRRKRSGLAWAATGLLLIAAVVGVGLIVADGINPPTALAAPLPQSGGVTSTTVIRYTYDALHRLTRASYSTGEVYTYTYDPVGNRLSENSPEGARTYAYDAADRLTSVNGVAYTYDANGNQLSDGTRTFTYDSANRLKQVVSGTLTTQYAYSGDGVRHAQVVNGVQTRYLVDVAAPLPQVLQETKAGATTRYLYGLGLIGTQDSGTWAYQHADGLGSIRQMSNSAGQIVLARSFTPFGAAKTTVGAAPGSFGFAGEQRDAASDLVFLRARYYDPTTGRFLTRDPYPAYASMPGTLHRYAYSRNDPVNLVDPSGLDPDRVGGDNFITRMLSEGVRNALCNIGGALGDLAQWLQSPEGGTAALIASGLILAGSVAAIIMTGGAAAIPMAVLLGAGVGALTGGVGQFVQDLSTGHWSSFGTYAGQIGIGALGGAVAGVIGLAGMALGLPMIATGGLTGFAVGTFSQAGNNFIGGQPWYSGVGQMAVVGAASGAFSGWLGGKLSPTAPLWQKFGMGGFSGAVAGGGTQVALNLASGRPWDEDLGTAIKVGAITGATGELVGHFAQKWVNARVTALDDTPDNPRRPGLPAREDGGWQKGQMTDSEYENMRQLAMKRGKRIALSGSLTETDKGFQNRYDPNYEFPERAAWRAKKPHSDLVSTGIGDIDNWEGSNLTSQERARMKGFFPEGFEFDKNNGYNLERYPDLAAFGEGGHGAGAIVFEPDGTTWRVPAAWQESRPPILADTDFLVSAYRGDVAALAEIRAGKTFITPNQYSEFLAGGAGRRAFLGAEGIQMVTGSWARQLASTPEFRQTFRNVAKAQGRGDAALAAFARATGFEAVTRERRLYNYLTQTVRSSQVPIRRFP